MNLNLFNTSPEPWTEPLSPGALVLRQYATAHTDHLLAGIHAIAAQAPFRHMQTPGSYTMSVAMTNCGLCLMPRLASVAVACASCNMVKLL